MSELCVQRPCLKEKAANISLYMYTLVYVLAYKQKYTILTSTHTHPCYIYTLNGHIKTRAMSQGFYCCNETP